MGAPRTPLARSTGCNQYVLSIRRRALWWLTQPMKRMSRLARTLAPVGAVLAALAGAVPAAAAETSALVQQSDPVPLVIVGSSLVIAALAAADAKADRRGH